MLSIASNLKFSIHKINVNHIATHFLLSSVDLVTMQTNIACIVCTEFCALWMRILKAYNNSFANSMQEYRSLVRSLQIHNLVCFF